MDYKVRMKQCVVLKEYMIPDNSAKFELYRIKIPVRAQIVPKYGTVYRHDAKFSYKHQ